MSCESQAQPTVLVSTYHTTHYIRSIMEKGRKIPQFEASLGLILVVRQ